MTGPAVGIILDVDALEAVCEVLQDNWIRRDGPRPLALADGHHALEGALLLHREAEGGAA